jgi:nondiscriminating glutamyl-tRNA synthetase
MARHETPNPAPAAAVNNLAGRDIAEILRAQRWLTADASPAEVAWCERAAALLGPQASDRCALLELLHVVFHYDAREILAKVETHAVLSRYAARHVLRHLALLLLDGAPLTTDRFKEVVNTLRENLGIRSRELFHPIRLALAGRAGGGELDRVILLVEEAAALSFATRVKSARERILEFCAALD